MMIKWEKLDNMKYIGKFKSINNQNYTVYIITNKSETVVKEIDLGESPFVSEMDTSDENIYRCYITLDFTI